MSPESWAILGVLVVAAFFIRMWWLQRDHGHPTDNFHPGDDVVTSSSPAHETDPVEADAGSDEEEDEDPDDDQESQAVIDEIEAFDSVDELMEFVNDLDEHRKLLAGGENDALLAKAQEFEDELDEYDWNAIFNIAEEGSELESYAGERGTE